MRLVTLVVDRIDMNTMINKNISSEKLGTITKSLNQARIAHVQWLNDLNRQIIFKMPIDSFARNHTECYLGKWLNSIEPSSAFDIEEYQKLVLIHKNLHSQANRLLDFSLTGNSIEAKDYELFINLVNNVMLSIENIQSALNTFKLSLDSLTQLANRKLLLFMLEKEYSKFKRNGTDNQHCIAFVDIDHFKNINDTYGHHAGDLVLKKVSEKLLSGMRENDILGRYGGEEFLFFLSDVSVQVAIKIFERIRLEIEKFDITLQTKELIGVTISIGIAKFSKSYSLLEIIEHADKAMYSAKTKGRNRVQVYETKRF